MVGGDGQCGYLHTGQLHVHAVAGRTIQLAGSVQATGWLADQAKIGRLLEHDAGRCRQRHGSGRLDQFTVAQLAATGGMHHGSTACQAAGGVDLPALRGRLHQQHAGGGAGLAHRHPRCAHGGGTTGDLEAQGRVHVALVIGAGMFQDDVVEIDLQFFGNQHGDRGIGPLPHFHIRHGHGDPAITGDAQYGTGLPAAAGVRSARLGTGVRTGLGQQHPQHQATAAGSQGFEKKSTVGHGRSWRVHAAAIPVTGVPRQGWLERVPRTSVSVIDQRS